MHTPRAATHPRQLTVLHIAQPSDGGVARVVTDLVRAQRADGLRPVVLCPPGGLGEAAAEAGATVCAWSATREPGARVAQEAAVIARTVREIDPDLVHLHSAKAGLAGRLALRGRVPTVYQPHAWSFEAARGVTGALALRWERHAARWAHQIVCVSDDERRRGQRAGVRARWTVIRNGVDTAHFADVAPAELPRLTGDEAGAVRPVPGAEGHRPGDGTDGPDTSDGGWSPPDGEWGGSSSGLDHDTEEQRTLVDGGRPPVVVCVGRLCRQKGQDVLLRAWPEIAARVPGARLVLVGDGPDAERLRAAAPDGVDFVGAVPDAAPWYAAASLVVAPSRWEGMALVPLEALAAGRPVVMSDVAGARESLPPAHTALCLVPQDDPVTLGRAVTRLLNDPRRADELGEQGRRFARSEHDVGRTAAAFSRLYRSMLTPGTPRSPLSMREFSRP
ncbi:glycosyltransferase family 4 protein [Streptomyces spiramenti]|uniref:Glycosyltransferase family 4 protein n=1 Tax=Streptomyces spiramenti TaxID=2720606 RepID=A0ABX1ARG5_9ACTN|nr:glycosyltransferase family 4 protein [Streptomyces spiramenti]NJP68023.1 glycosyltransferase family 4 protein [Streptomyces spiramenti]